MDDSINKVIAIFDAQVESTGSALRLEQATLKTKNIHSAQLFTTLHTNNTRQGLQLASEILDLNKTKSSLSSMANASKIMKRKIEAANDYSLTVNAAADAYNKASKTANQL